MPPKHEYVVSVRLSSLQISLYQQYLDNFTSASSLTSDGPGSKFHCAGLFSDYHSLMHIWTHPYVLRLDEIRQEKKVWTYNFTHGFLKVCAMSVLCCDHWLATGAMPGIRKWGEPVKIGGHTPFPPPLFPSPPFLIFPISLASPPPSSLTFLFSLPIHIPSVGTAESQMPSPLSWGIGRAATLLKTLLQFHGKSLEALPGVAYPGFRDNRSTLNTKTGF